MKKLATIPQILKAVKDVYPAARLEPAEFDCVDDDIEVNDKVSVQIGETYMCVNRCEDDGYVFGREIPRLTDNFHALLEDLKKAVEHDIGAAQ